MKLKRVKGRKDQAEATLGVLWRKGEVSFEDLLVACPRLAITQTKPDSVKQQLQGCSCAWQCRCCEEPEAVEVDIWHPK